jgi:hypothetical protein
MGAHDGAFARQSPSKPRGAPRYGVGYSLAIIASAASP